MKTINEVLDEAKKARGLDTDYKLAKTLSVTPNYVVGFRDKTRAIDNLTACRLADIIGCDPMQVIAIVELDRAKNDEKAGFWRNFLNQRFGKSAASVALVLCLTMTAALSGFGEGSGSNLTAKVASAAEVVLALLVLTYLTLHNIQMCCQIV
ncbi:hypothetical protein [Silvimonas soli]|uniref:hypothetical protein n=1 Tax=Silvimonas soli TaxID=2980100 RepID=UPI0024B39350|nr:hypothetical protein [Silvimonas soli]